MSVGPAKFKSDKSNVVDIPGEDRTEFKMIDYSFISSIQHLTKLVSDTDGDIDTKTVRLKLSRPQTCMIHVA